MSTTHARATQALDIITGSGAGSSYEEVADWIDGHVLISDMDALLTLLIEQQPHSKLGEPNSTEHAIHHIRRVRNRVKRSAERARAFERLEEEVHDSREALKISGYTHHAKCLVDALQALKDSQ